MKKVISTALFAIFLFNIKAQTVFVTNAKITFEKKINIHRQLENESWLDNDAKDKIQKYVSSLWDLNFNEIASSYKVVKKETTVNNNIFMFSQGENTAEMFTNLNKGQRIIKKQIIDEDYILNDTIPQVNWKIMHDVRKIAGYECRKAIGVINDSIYVVAFYTDEILFKGGPEGFTGLPGMILGLAIPRYNTTWFATKIEAVNIPIQEIAEPSKGKRVDSEKEFNKLMSLFTGGNKNKDPKAIEAIKKILYGLTL